MSVRMSLQSIIVCLLALIQIGSCIRCYQCRSDERPDCGDPFVPGSIPSVECNNHYLTETFVCYKISHSIGIGYITARGCAPFNKDFFPANMQKGMAGDYWKGQSNVFSMCDVNNCNSGRMVQFTVMSLLLSLLPMTLM